MVGHQARGRNLQIPDLRGFLEKLDKLSVVSFVRDNGLTPPRAIHDMVPCTRVLHSQGSGYAAIYPFLRARKMLYNSLITL